MNQQLPHKYPVWAEKYISLVDNNIYVELEKQIHDIPNFFNNYIEKADYAYAPSKWTIRQLQSHIIDTERVLMFRLVSISRGDTQVLPGFDEDAFVNNTISDKRSLFEMGEEFRYLRKANLLFINALSESELDRVGNANNFEISTRALAFVLVGHVKHHQKIIIERY